MKKVLIGIGVVVLLLAIAGGVGWYIAFGNNRPIVDGQILAPGVQVVKNSFVSAVILDTSPGKVALVDTGNDDSGKPILAALAARGLKSDAVEAVFLTHGHPDHVNGLKAFPAAQVYALEAEAAMVGKVAKVTHPLKDGEVTHLGDLQIETFAVPGHTAGSAVYFARGVLFFGDSAGGSKEGKLMPAVKFFTDDPALNVASLKALTARLAPRAQEVKTLQFAHTGPLEGLAPLSAFASTH